MQLRPYQIRTLNELWAAMQVKLNILATAPCSAGKTILFSKLIQRLLRENPSFRCLILVDREILVSQSADKLGKVAPELALSIGIVCASVTSKKRIDKPVTIASRQTLINQMDRFPPVQLCICDESHLMGIPHEDNLRPDQWSEIISTLRGYNPQMRLLGFTASPYRLGSRGGYIYGDKNRADALPYFDQVDAQITTAELESAGFIAPLTGRAQVDGDFLSDLQNVSMTGGDYNLSQLAMMMSKTINLKSCVDAWMQYAAGDRKKTLVFCTTIEHAEAVVKAFQDAGQEAKAIHSKLPKLELSLRMQDLENKPGIYTSVAKLTTGMDVSDIDCIILARPTKSTALYQQIIGRGQRLAPGKTDCLVLDLVGATKEFGTDMDNLRVNYPKGSGGGEAPTKICQGEKSDGSVCGASVHASLRYCPECGYQFEIDEAVEAALGTMKKVDFNKKPEPVEYKVESVEYFAHESKSSGKELVKVRYNLGFSQPVFDWICLPDYYSGYAVDKARIWWDARSTEDFPNNIDEFLFLADDLMEPVKITVVDDGKFKKITEYDFGEDLEGTDPFPVDDFMTDYEGTGDEVPF